MNHDYHVHSQYSDGASLESMVQAAVDADLDGVGISDHADILSSTGGIVDTYPDRREEIQTLRDEHDIQIFDAVEIDYYPGEEEMIREFLDVGEFDYAIGSVHRVEEVHVMTPAEFVDYSDEEKQAAVDGYVAILERMIHSEIFDVIAHLDVFERNVELRGFATEDHYERLGVALEASRTHPEINAGRVFDEYGELHPRPSFLSVLSEYDISFVPGTDSHTPEQLRERAPHLREFFSENGIVLDSLSL